MTAAFTFLCLAGFNFGHLPLTIFFVSSACALVSFAWAVGRLLITRGRDWLPTSMCIILSLILLVVFAYVFVQFKDEGRSQGFLHRMEFESGWTRNPDAMNDFNACRWLVESGEAEL